MAKDQPSQPSPEGAEWNTAKEQELDDLLDKACSLAHEIKREVSDSGIESNLTPPDSTENSEARAIDKQLDDIDRLLDTAREQIDAEPAAMGHASASPTTAAPALKGEFSGDPVARPSAASGISTDNPTRNSPANSGANPGTDDAVQSAPAASAVTTVVEEPEDDLLALSASTPRPLPQPTATTDAADGKAESPGSVDRSLFTRTVGNPLVAVLTLVNRPFDRLGMRTRTYLGYAALLMLAAAAVVLAISLV